MKKFIMQRLDKRTHVTRTHIFIGVIKIKREKERKITLLRTTIRSGYAEIGQLGRCHNATRVSIPRSLHNVTDLPYRRQYETEAHDSTVSSVERVRNLLRPIPRKKKILFRDKYLTSFSSRFAEFTRMTH